MRATRTLQIAGLLLAVASCRREPETAGADSQVHVRHEPRPPNRFDPASIESGDTVVGLVVRDIERQRTPSGEWVGSVRFIGTVTLSGHTFSHPDGADYPFPCFEADSSSARRLPRWAGDERRPWFCFENREVARSRVGRSAGRPATIRVDQFTIHRNLSDAVNSARLIDVASIDRSAETANAHCFVTSGSVLARKPGTVAPGPEGLIGWIWIDRPRGSKSGQARLVDSDGRTLGAKWELLGADSVSIVGFDDFLRVEMQVFITDDVATGSASARSDAATERDSAGRPVPFRRIWRVNARRINCEGLPRTRPT